jgi:hypothetical protein
MHLPCAARDEPRALTEALGRFTGEIPNRAEIDELLAKKADKLARTEHGFPYVERAATGRSKCIGCGSLVEKGALRIAIGEELEVGGMMRTVPRYLHPACARKRDDGAEILEKVLASPALAADEREELEPLR